jgi:hypothetical protein
VLGNASTVVESTDSPAVVSAAVLVMPAATSNVIAPQLRVPEAPVSDRLVEVRVNRVGELEPTRDPGAARPAADGLVQLGPVVARRADLR